MAAGRFGQLRHGVTCGQVVVVAVPSRLLSLPLKGQYTESGKDLAVALSSVASIQDLVSGLAFSLQLFVEFSINFNMEFFMETNLFTVFNAVKSECASLHGG